ncbi:threonine/serine dehydratase [Wenxinia marina]|uniref:L-threonine ammonia-lyase n=1 Tax=Wenxinia marina DSM 24838 TaxID=1123501 RepID=A0A0D0Q8Q2_9RHOB|nr:threonine/serine dehydratase [Wenxinia marina]KIQ70769.1 L-threonine ammonia-lyase [Wenxinia marina DSM 24838]GGL80299.1 threonine dehydratase [Wenxinia marina]
MPAREGIEAAAKRIAGHVAVTPVMESAALWSRPVVLKLEQAQLTGSFKVRGAFNTLLSGPVPAAGVVAASGGNHGAAVALAARTLGHRAKIFVPEVAGPAKIALIRETGADLMIVPGGYADALVVAQDFEAESGAMQIHAYDAPATVTGQGTTFREWDAQGLDADTVLIAVGGGGLIAGALAWWGDRRRVVAVEPEQAPTLATALRDGPDAQVEVGGIAANALGARTIGRMCHALASARGIEVALVPDEAIAAAQTALWRTHRLLVEPAGATALAALMCGAYVPAPDERVAVLLCGGNVAPDPLARS